MQQMIRKCIPSFASPSSLMLTLPDTHSIITSTQLLDELPRRRFLNIRLHYTDDTPTEYEPPSFKWVHLCHFSRSSS